MSFFSRLRDALLPRSTHTRSANPQPVSPQPMPIDGLPPFNLHLANAMRYDPQVRIGLGARNGLLMSAEVEVTGEQRAMVRWVQAQWERIWCSCAHHLLRAKLYGFQPFEVFYREAGGEFAGLLEFDHLRDLPPGETRLLMDGDTPVGLELKRSWAESAGHSLSQKGSANASSQNTIRLLAPQALVCTFDAQCGNPYGCALLARAYPAWYEKWMEGGVKRTLRLRMIKDAYIGDILWYPPDRKVQMPDGREVGWRDIAREVVETRMSGGALTLPLLRDRDGHKLIEYTPPQGVTGITSIFMWKKDIDLEIWKALEVPPEIIQASTSGSGFSGRWIPFVVALSAVHLELAELIRCIDRDILRPLARLNFAAEPRYDIRPKSLVEIYARKFAERGVGSDSRTTFP